MDCYYVMDNLIFFERKSTYKNSVSGQISVFIHLLSFNVQMPLMYESEVITNLHLSFRKSPANLDILDHMYISCECLGILGMQIKVCT
jgi:hypothetical protein